MASGMSSDSEVVNEEGPNVQDTDEMSTASESSHPEFSLIRVESGAEEKRANRLNALEEEMRSLRATMMKELHDEISHERARKLQMSERLSNAHKN